jgi:hypothetical protein
VDPLYRILDDLATHHPKLVLVQGRRYWRIEDLVRQAKQDMVRNQRDRSKLSEPAFDQTRVDGKIVILGRGGQVVFVEAGSDLRTEG